MAEVAKLLGTPLMPWQQQVADVGLEVDLETGLMAFREIIVTVMRQSGKTSLVFPIEVERCTMWPEPQRVIYTAQTGADARKKMLEDQVPILERSTLYGAIRHIHRAQGNENIHFRTGSRISVAASSKDSGHGFTVDLGVLDESWNDEDDRREQAMLPAMATRPNAQLLLTSTMGTDASVYLNRKVEAGRHAAATNKSSGIAYFEWSIPPDADIENPETWWEYMPALGWTISEAAIAHALQTMEEVEWRRAYANQSTKTKHDRIIPLVLWESVCGRAAVDRSRNVYLAIDVLPERSAGAIAVSDGLNVELVDHRAGTGWIVERVRELRESWGGTVTLDGGGPAASVGDDLVTAGIPVERLGTSEVAAACACMFDAIADGKVRIQKNDRLDAAVEGLAKRPIADRFIWSRSASLSDITPFFAATLALERAVHQLQVEVAFYSFD